MNGATLIGATLMFPLTELIILIITLIIYLRYFAKLSIGFDIEFSKTLMKKSSFFCLSLIFVGLLLYVDTIMLQKIRGSTEVGIYVAAYNLLLGLTFIPLMYSNAIFPVFSRYFVKDKSLLRFAYRKSFQYMLLLGLPISIGIYVYAQNIILLIYCSGHYVCAYDNSIITLKILCWMIALRFINIVPGTALSSINRQSSRVLSQGTVTAINIILNLILIPKLGFIGAGIATIISESFFILMYGYFITKYGLRFEILKTLLKPLIASAIMALVIINIPNLLVGTIVGAVSYLGTLILIKTFNKEDKTILKRIIRDQ
jgi:O-antigen/teichoic acid export membrane protein